MTKQIQVIQANAELVTPDTRWIDLSKQIIRTEHAMGNGVRQIVIAGVMMEEIKATCKHGEFGPELRKHCFADATEEEFENKWRTARRWMETAASALGILQIGHDVRFEALRLSDLLQTPKTELPDDAQAVQSKIFDFIAGKSQKQLQLEWKDADPQLPGGFKPKASQVEKWIEKEHPELVGKKFSELPKAIQKEFQKQAYKPEKLSPKKQAELEEAGAEADFAAFMAEGDLLVLKTGKLAALTDATRKLFAERCIEWGAALKAKKNQKA